MPWSNQSGGGSGGGPWGQRGPGGKSPWGNGPQGGGTPPDLEDILRRGQDRIRDLMPGGGSMGGRGAVVLLLGVFAIWLLTGFYTVRPNEIGINMTFGAYTRSCGEGLRYNWPYPIGRVENPDVSVQQPVEVG